MIPEILNPFESLSIFSTLFWFIGFPILVVLTLHLARAFSSFIGFILNSESSEDIESEWQFLTKIKNKISKVFLIQRKKSNE